MMPQQYVQLQKLVEKGKKIHSPKNLWENLLAHVAHHHRDELQREFNFLTLYYGLQGNALTLEAIGQTQPSPLTRERVRQIIDAVLISILIPECQELKRRQCSNPYTRTLNIFDTHLQNKRFVRLHDLCKDVYFLPFKENVKGLISFLNDCGIRQITYRKNYYFYLKQHCRQEVIEEIQQENKTMRRSHTLAKMSQKAKTVTYVPDEIRQHLIAFAQKNNSNLNPLYESILLEFIQLKPYEHCSFEFCKTKSWRARKGKAQWQQVGIYIERDVFNKVKEIVQQLRLEQNKRVSLMSFICQAFLWHQHKHMAEQGRTNTHACSSEQEATEEKLLS